MLKSERLILEQEECQMYGQDKGNHILNVLLSEVELPLAEIPRVKGIPVPCKPAIGILRLGSSSRAKKNRRSG
jgi:hypothetical protein